MPAVLRETGVERREECRNEERNKNCQLPRRCVERVDIKRNRRNHRERCPDHYGANYFPDKSAVHLLFDESCHRALHFIRADVVHAFEVPLRTLSPADVRAGTAIERIIFDNDGLITVRRETEFLYS